MDKYFIYDIIRLANPIIGLLVNIAAQVIACRYISGVTLLKSIFFGFISGTSWIIIIECYLFHIQSTAFSDFIPILIFNLITFSSLGIFYFHFINLGETGRRVRILRELFKSKNGLTEDEIFDRYSARNIVNIRIKRLISKDQIKIIDDKYFISKPVMLLLTRIIYLIKNTVFGRKYV